MRASTLSRARPLIRKPLDSAVRNPPQQWSGPFHAIRQSLQGLVNDQGELQETLAEQTRAIREMSTTMTEMR